MSASSHNRGSRKMEAGLGGELVVGFILLCAMAAMAAGAYAGSIRAGGLSIFLLAAAAVVPLLVRFGVANLHWNLLLAVYILNWVATGLGYLAGAALGRKP
jgi:hypothetical protein